MSVFEKAASKEQESYYHSEKTTSISFGVIDESSLSREEWLQKAQRVEQLGPTAPC